MKFRNKNAVIACLSSFSLNPHPLSIINLIKVDETIDEISIGINNVIILHTQYFFLYLN